MSEPDRAQRRTKSSPAVGSTPTAPAASPVPGTDEPEPLYPAEIHRRQAHRLRPAPGPGRAARPLPARLAMAAAALVITACFAAVAVFSLGGGDLLLGTMAALGSLLSAWVGWQTVRDA